MGTRQNTSILSILLSLLVIQQQYQLSTADFQCTVRDFQNYTDSIRDCDDFKTITFDIEKWERIPRDLIEKTQSIKTVRITEHKIRSLDNKGFCDWPTLSSIVANNNSIASLPSRMLMGCRFLNLLDLSKNNISEIYEDAFHGLSALFDLNLSNNQISALSSNVFKPLRSLKILRLNNNLIGAIDFDHFQTNEKLQSIDLSYNKIAVIEKGSFWKLKQLSTLDVSVNPELNDIDLSEMDRLKTASIDNASLTSLHIPTNVMRVSAVFNNISRVTIDPNGALENLNLRNNQFRDIRYLSQAEKLTDLDISENNITNIEFAHLMGTQIHHLTILKNPIKTFNVRELTSLKELRTIEISFNLLDNQTLLDLDNQTRILHIQLIDPDRDQEIQARTNPITLPPVTPVTTKDVPKMSTILIDSTTMSSTTVLPTPKSTTPASDSKDTVILELLKRIRKLESSLGSNSDVHNQMLANVSNLRIMIVCTIIAFSIFVSFQIVMFVSTRYNGWRLSIPNALSNRVNGIVNHHRQRNVHNSMDPIMEEVL